jgi:hypothetical protein
MTRATWNDFEFETPLQRVNARGPPYNISHDRYLPPAHSDGNRHSGRTYQLAHDNSHNEIEEEQDTSKKSERRRIPVAV